MGLRGMFRNAIWWQEGWQEGWILLRWWLLWRWFLLRWQKGRQEGWLLRIGGRVRNHLRVNSQQIGTPDYNCPVSYLTSYYKTTNITAIKKKEGVHCMYQSKREENDLL